MYKLEILHQSIKRVKTKVLGANSYVCRSYRGKTGRDAFLHPLPPILNRVKMEFIQTLCWDLRATSILLQTITRCVNHQITTLDMHLKNLKVMLVFSNELVEVPHNATMHKEMAGIEERQAIWSCCSLNQALTRDISAYNLPCSLILER